jgi:hypothetical protein
VFTPRRFFSATIADLGYAGNLFVYTLDFATGELHEEGVIVPLGRGIELPRNSLAGVSRYEDQRLSLRFSVEGADRCVAVDWPGFHAGRGMHAEVRLACPPEQESLNIVIPIPEEDAAGKKAAPKRFYYNHKINCLPASGQIQYGAEQEILEPGASLGGLDWGRGVWPYRSFWNWASASAYLPDGRRLGLNLGQGFGDLSQATENCFSLDGRIHKLEGVRWKYQSGEYLRPWNFQDAEGRLHLEMIPFKERLARANLGLIFSEVHQVFGRYSGWVATEAGETIPIAELIGFAEEHQARW